LERLIDTAEKKVILDNEFATLWCFPEDKIIYHRFKKFAQGDNFRNVLLTGADEFERRKCTKWLSEDVKIGVLDKKDTDWGETNWTPRVVKAGWKQWANIMPERVAGKMRTKNVIEHFKSFGVEVRVFEDPNDAYMWLSGKA
jgi:hypothetical protein